MIEAEGLTKRYGRTVAVDGIDFQVKPGVVTAWNRGRCAGVPAAGSCPSLSRYDDTDMSALPGYGRRGQWLTA